jgi:hypothetical protein
MIQHERNDPRRPQREAAEKARQDRRTRYLILVIGLLGGIVLGLVCLRLLD